MFRVTLDVGAACAGTTDARGLALFGPPPRGRSLEIANRFSVQIFDTSCEYPPVRRYLDSTLRFPTKIGLRFPDVAMAVDPLSPIAPARIRALLLPMGRIKRSRFIAFVDILQQEALVRLGDISPDPRPDRSTSTQDLFVANVC